MSGLNGILAGKVGLVVGVANEHSIAAGCAHAFHDSGTELVHTLNGTACAISRTLVFLFEHYQEADGGFAVPDALQPFTGFDGVAPR